MTNKSNIVANELALCEKAYLQAVQEPNRRYGPPSLSWVVEDVSPDERSYTSFEVLGNYLVETKYVVAEKEVTIDSLEARNLDTITRVALPSHSQSKAEYYLENGIGSEVPLAIARKILWSSLKS